MNQRWLMVALMLMLGTHSLLAQFQVATRTLANRTVETVGDPESNFLIVMANWQWRDGVDQTWLDELLAEYEKSGWDVDFIWRLARQRSKIVVFLTRKELIPFIGTQLAESDLLVVQDGAYVSDFLQINIFKENMSNPEVYETLNIYFNHGWAIIDTALADGIVEIQLKRMVSIEQIPTDIRFIANFVSIEPAQGDFYSPKFHEIVNAFLSAGGQLYADWQDDDWTMRIDFEK